MSVINKNAADNAPIDNFLFGQNFAEILKAAQACKKAGPEVVKATSFSGKKTLQLIRQQDPPRRIQPQTYGRETRKPLFVHLRLAKQGSRIARAATLAFSPDLGLDHH